jgi:membrane complex biogenesis BtpA family protein
MREVLSRAKEDADLLTKCGMDGLLLENYGDTPFFPGEVPPETIAAMTLVAGEVAGSSPVPVGVNVLRNHAAAAVAVAAVTGARFVRVNVHTGSMFTDQGLIQGHAAATLRAREALGAPVAILADVMVKHATPPAGATLEGVARDAWQRGSADGLILTGVETGNPVEVDEIGILRAALPPEARLWIGSGATADNAPSLLALADGLIVGSALKLDGRAGGPVDPERLEAFMSALGRA